MNNMIERVVYDICDDIYKIFRVFKGPLYIFGLIYIEDTLL